MQQNANQGGDAAGGEADDDDGDEEEAGGDRSKMDYEGKKELRPKGSSGDE